MWLQWYLTAVLRTICHFSPSRQEVILFPWVPVTQAECWFLLTSADHRGYNPDRIIHALTLAWPVHTCIQQHSGHRTLCIMGLKTQIKLEWQKQHKKFGCLQKKHQNFTLLKKYGAILATTAYWICSLAQIAFVSEFISCLECFLEVRTSWLVENHTIFLKMRATILWLWVLWLSTLIVLSYMLLWLAISKILPTMNHYLNFCERTSW